MEFEILQHSQSKTLRPILYLNNHRMHDDLQINTVLSEIKKWDTKYLRKL
jgi:ribosome-binding ATPase YchF (GTP1/OBG family)